MSDRPQHLYEVLEDEYERIQGKPSPSAGAGANSEERLKNIIKENHKQQLSAICLSGGGIRSATFGLGVLQGLAHNKLLSKFSYLSTVSGGGYVGGWLSAWIHRHPQGLAGVEHDLPSEHPSFLLKPEPEPITHLRSYSNYLTPKLGLLSADTWTLVAIIVRNLLLNWLVLIPLMVAVLALPRLFVSFSQWSPPDYMRVAAFVLGFICGVVMIVYVAISRPSITDKHRGQAQFLKWCLLPLLVSATLLALYWAWFTNNEDHNLEKSLTFHLFDTWNPAFRFIIFGVLLHLVGWVIYTPMLKSSKVRTWFEFFALIFNGAVGGLLLWLVASRVFPHPSIQYWAHQDFEVRELLLYSSFSVPLYLVLVFLAVTLFAGVSSRYTEDEDREWWARYSGWILIAVVIWAAASFLVLVGPPLSGYLWARFAVPAGGLIGLITALLARSDKLPAKNQPGARGLTGFLMSYALPLGTIIFAAVLVVVLSVGTNYLIEWVATPLRWLLPKVSVSIDWLHNQTADVSHTGRGSVGSVVIFPSAREVFILIGLTGGLGVLMARLINTNKFSQHAMYRNRLIRAYLGASRESGERHPDPFTGFDPADNLSMCELRPELLHSRSFKDFEKFVSRLQAKTDPESAHILSKILSTDSTRLLRTMKSCDPGDHSRWLLQNALIKDLNKALLKPEPIFRPAAAQTGSTDSLRKGDAMLARNRELLVAAYQDEILPAPAQPYGPLHVINMTLNLVHGERLAWQERQAESFTVTPLHCGSFQIPDSADRTLPVYGSYRRTQEYAGDGGITIGTAVAISGAAVSPNMGYYSSPIVTFLMTLFNVRLGWWLGNPGRAGEEKRRWYHKLLLTDRMRRFFIKDYYPLAYPKSAVYPIIAEALGLTDDRNSYVYLSDGGHFENLGLYEMVLRRCRMIVVSDASDDAEFQFDNLGNAVKKVRIDLGIPIEFKSMQIFPRKEKKKGAFCAIGTIRYSAVDEVDKIGADKKPVLDETGNPIQVPAPDGIIIYVKPVFYGDEPRDIYHYGMTHETFPHESTVNQWFSESQFESYRKLGSYIVDTICKYSPGVTSEVGLSDRELSEFLQKAQQSAQAEDRASALGHIARLTEGVAAIFKPEE